MNGSVLICVVLAMFGAGAEFSYGRPRDWLFDRLFDWR